MKRKVILTGTSRGLGKALADKFLERGDEVLGISRGQSIQHENYHHFSFDLTEVEKIDSLDFGLNQEYHELVLINNAGTLGDIKHIGGLSSEGIIKSQQLNVIAPMILINKFCRETSNLKTNNYVLNIGSGAASKAMDGWSLYCSSKASLKMFADVFSTENQIRAKNVNIVDLAPGIVETEMQEIIRSQKEKDFSSLPQFKAYKENQELSSPEEVADKILSNFKALFEKGNFSQSIRNY